MEGRRCRWLDRIRRTCAGGSWRRWRRAPRPGRGGGGLRSGAPPAPAGRGGAGGGGAGRPGGGGGRVEGRRTARRMGGGPKPRIAGEVEAALLGLKEANHLTLAECR